MKYILFLFLCFWGVVFSTSVLHAQQISFRVTDSETNETLPGVTCKVVPAGTGAVSDDNGWLKISFVPVVPNQQTFTFSMIGYAERKLKLNLAGMKDTLISVQLIPEGLEEETVVIEATRSDRTIADLPTRVEVITEELEESMLMDPAKIAHLLTHSTGVQVQQTSAGSGAANIRIQGMDGRYAQILKDGFPLYGGLSSSLAITQIPPLDLRQVEYIKGSASVLYGGGAISGLINLVSKEPTLEKPHLTELQFNASSLGSVDFNAFTLHRFNRKLGLTVMASRNTQAFYDPDNQGFANLPQTLKYNLNPRLFYFLNDSTKLILGATFTDETRKGGDIERVRDRINDENHFFLDESFSDRKTTQIMFEHRRNGKHIFTLKNGLNFFHRRMNQQYVPLNRAAVWSFEGEQFSTFSEGNYVYRSKKHTFTSGLNFYTDRFDETRLSNPVLRNERQTTAGFFAGHTWDISERIITETGIRTDYNINHGWFVLPKVSILVKYNSLFSSRFGGGMGYKLPTMLVPESELWAFRFIQSLNQGLKPERSYNLQGDFNYRFPVGRRIAVSGNVLAFYNYLTSPILLVSAGQSLALENNALNFQSKGAEARFKIVYRQLTLYAGYTLTYASLTNDPFGKDLKSFPLTPRHSLKGDIMYVIPDKWRIGIDMEYKSEQILSDGRTVRGFFTAGLLVERTLGNFILYGNLENVGNIRQTRFESIRSLPENTPQLTEIWAPMDGLYFNAGFRIRL